MAKKLDRRILYGLYLGSPRFDAGVPPPAKPPAKATKRPMPERKAPAKRKARPLTEEEIDRARGYVSRLGGQAK
jgi:hypothetical protein